MSLDVLCQMKIDARRCTRLALAAALSLLAQVVHADDTPRKGGTLVVAINSDPANLITGTGSEPQKLQLAGQIFDTLVKVDTNLKVTPGLAKSWEMASDGLSYTFHLEENATWHDGKPVTSEDVKYSYLEISGKYNSGATVYAKQLAGIDTPDPHTVVFRLTSPDSAYFPWAFAGQNFELIYPKHVYEGTDPRTNPANFKPIGSGAFVFKEWERGNHITLERNPKYFHADKVFLDRIVYQIIPDPGAREIAIEKGEVDHIPYFGLSPASVDALSSKGLEIADTVRPAFGIMWDPLESTCRHASLSIL